MVGMFVLCCGRCLSSVVVGMFVLCCGRSVCPLLWSVVVGMSSVVLGLSCGRSVFCCGSSVCPLLW